MIKIIVFTSFCALLNFSCESTCLESVDNFTQFKRDGQTEYAKFNIVVDEYYSTNKLVIYIDPSGCVYVNSKVRDSSLKSTIHQYLLANRSNSYEVVLLPDPIVLNNNFKLLKDIHLELKEAYLEIWQGISYDHYQSKDIDKLDYNQKSALWAAFPAKSTLRFDYISEEQSAIFRNKLFSQLPPINPLIMSRDTKGLH